TTTTTPTPPTLPSNTPNPKKPHPKFHPTLTHLLTPLHPLISSTTGHPHPDFPTSLLTYNLLTSSQLDALATHFHQVYPPVPATYWYPVSIPAWMGRDGDGGKGVDLETKRRRFGRFIGLRGCESPTFTTGASVGVGGNAGDREGDGDEAKEKEVEESPQEMLERMEREWVLGLLRARFEGDVAMRWKFG
ncbi:uncharacterized protein BO80DRAFT_335534, partial [Aspergillus ibericus CBS 121593]